MSKVRVGVIGVGNCCSALVQGISYYAGRNDQSWIAGLMHPVVGGYGVDDIEIVAAWDIDRRKVGKSLSEAIFALPNCTTIFQKEIRAENCTVQRGADLDGIAQHMRGESVVDGDKNFLISELAEPDQSAVVEAMKKAGVEVVINYLPVGSELASRWYAECALEAGCAFVNCMPTLIASDPKWQEKFAERGLPIIGDDIKSQIGATIIHRQMAELFKRRGATIDQTYQINVGGNSDFQNMKDQSRLKTKKISKSEAVQSAIRERLADKDLHIGPSDFIPWLNDNKVAFIRIEGRLFGDVPMNIEMRVSVEDSPNSAGVAVDMIRCAKMAMDRKVSGPLLAPSAFLCKHPPVQMTETEAWEQTEQFIDRSSDK